MNSFLNPLFSLRMMRHYFTDINRAWKFKPDEIKRYQDRTLKKVLKYAYSVPLYHKKYKDAGIHPEDISGVDELYKLPLITKEDLIQAYPNEFLPINYNKKNAYIVSTSGSSGKPLSMYKDIGCVTIETLCEIRQFRTYGINWRKSRITNIGDFFLSGSSDEECLRNGLMNELSLFFPLNNCQHLCTSEKVKNLLEKIEEFEPELIIGYASVLRGIASLKREKDYKKAHPRVIISSGEILDPYSRDYIETAFDADVFDLYATTEGGPMAFECLEKKLHINSDFVHVEILDKNEQPVHDSEIGNIVITRLYPGGTPIIRYAGLNDIAALESDRCDCGNNTPLLKSLEGRKNDIIISPDGRIFPAATIPLPLIKISNKFQSHQIKRFQFIQEKIDEIQILIEMDDEKNVNTEKLLDEIKKDYQEFLGRFVNIQVKEIKEFERIGKELYPPQIISKIDKKKFQDLLM